MKIECCSCNEQFEIPDGKGINRAICPFCEKPNDLRKRPVFDHSSGKESATQDNAPKPAEYSVLKPSHPLAPQFWIISICTLIITTIIVGFIIIGIVDSYQETKEMEAFSKRLNKVGKETSAEIDKSTRQLQQSLNKLLKP